MERCILVNTDIYILHSKYIGRGWILIIQNSELYIRDLNNSDLGVVLFTVELNWEKHQWPKADEALDYLFEYFCAQ